MLSILRSSIVKPRNQYTKSISSIQHLDPHLTTKKDIARIISLTPFTNKKSNEFISFFNGALETYLKMKSIKPVITFLETKGIRNIKQEMNDHMALRTPNLETGVAMIQDLIQSGLYKFEYHLESNATSGEKLAICDINIAGGSQYGVTLIATSKAKNHHLPNYVFISIRLDHENSANLYQDMNKPFKLCNDLTIYKSDFWKPAHKLTLEHGAFFPNHFTLKVTPKILETLKCKSIYELKSLFDEHGFEENKSVAVTECPDVTQFALKSTDNSENLGVYFEYLYRHAGKNGNLIHGFSTDTTNINRIGANASL